MDGKKIREDVRGDPVIAKISYGRWVATCPVCGETAVENVDPSDPVFFCFNCCNHDNDFHFRPVSFPVMGDQKLIEVALMQRKEWRDMEWTAKEKPEDLAKENLRLKAEGKVK